MILQIETLAALKEGLEQFKRFLIEEQVGETGVFHGKLVFSELVGNILKHSSATARVQSKIEDGFIEISVRASDGFIPPQTSCCSDVYDEGGRGLFIVDKICYKRFCDEDGTVRVLIQTETK